MSNNRNPVHWSYGLSALEESVTKEDAKAAGYKTPGWYFWDETWGNVYGPYDTEEEAEDQCEAYTKLMDDDEGTSTEDEPDDESDSEDDSYDDPCNW